MSPLPIGMPIALELRGVVKRYVAGAGSCSIRADVLRGIDLVVHSGEAIAIVGPACVGKSTLLLCAAGLLRPDAGTICWFEESSEATGALRSTFYFAGTATSRVSRLRCGRPHVHLIDAIEHLDPCRLRRLSAWVRRQCAAGDAVIVTSRDRRGVTTIVDRALTIRDGRLELEPRMSARVAEKPS